MERGDRAVRARLFEENRHLRESSQALCATSRELCEISRKTRARSAAIQDWCWASRNAENRECAC
jgi:hypothetical protein